MRLNFPARITYQKGTIVLGFGIFYLWGGDFPQARAEAGTPQVNWELSSCQPATFGFQATKSYAEQRRERLAALAQAEAKRQASLWPTEFVKISDKIKDPNSIKIPFAQAPGISAETREKDGRRVCADKKDKGNKSKQDGKGVHIDRECCLDPDEVPNPRCYYPELGDDNSPKRVVGPDGKKYIQ